VASRITDPPEPAAEPRPMRSRFEREAAAYIVKKIHLL